MQRNFCSLYCLFGLLVTAVIVSSSARADDLDDLPPHLTVSGQGEVFAKPDRAIVRLGAEVQENEAVAAQKGVNQKVSAAIERIKKLGIPDEAIQTSGLSLSPVYDRGTPQQRQEPKLVAYRASNTITVRIDDLGQVGKLIDASVAAGANELQGISFELKDQTAKQQAALREAVASAQSKASAMASAMGRKLGPVLRANEGGVQLLQQDRTYARQSLAASAALTPIQPGELRVRANVSLTYELQPGASEEGAAVKQ